MSLTDTTTPRKITKVSRSERNWLDSKGQPIADESEIGGNVAGFSYAYKPANKTFTKLFDFNKNPDEILMLAAFGGMTLAGNVANGKESDPQRAFADIEARFALIESGTWVERVGLGGPRYNAETLAAAISTVKHGNADQALTYLAKIGPDKPKVKVRNSAGVETEMDYGTYALTNPKVQDAYTRLSGKTQASDADL